MDQKGQIVEIPATSPLFKHPTANVSRYAELEQLSMPKNYGLFDGFLVGEHNGVSGFKLGQRKGLQLGGKKQPAYVIGIDKDEKRLFVGQGSQHPGLWASVLRFPNKGQLSNLKGDGHSYPVQLMTGSEGALQPATLFLYPNNFFLELSLPISIVVLDHPINVRLMNGTQSLIQIN